MLIIRGATGGTSFSYNINNNNNININSAYLQYLGGTRNTTDDAVAAERAACGRPAGI